MLTQRVKHKSKIKTELFYIKNESNASSYNNNNNNFSINVI